jgi:hypothetical protein
MAGRALGLASTLLALAVPVLGIEGADVGVFSTGAWDPGLVAFEHFLDWKGLTHERLTSGDVDAIDLSEYYEAIAIPGGSSLGYEANISSDGEAHIRAFVEGGGGYVGICGGGYLAADSISFNGVTYDFPLDLFDGLAVGPLTDITTTLTMTTISSTVSNPVNEYQPATHVTLYSGGAAFYPHAGAFIETVATYDDHDGDCAIINFPYGDGRVLLMGPHPELEEDSGRDGTAHGDEFDDEGSEWGLLWSAMDWVLGRAISDSSFARPTQGAEEPSPER